MGGSAANATSAPAERSTRRPVRIRKDTVRLRQRGVHHSYYRFARELQCEADCCLRETFSEITESNATTEARIKKLGEDQGQRLEIVIGKIPLSPIQLRSRRTAMGLTYRLCTSTLFKFLTPVTSHCILPSLLSHRLFNTSPLIMTAASLPGDSITY